MKKEAARPRFQHTVLSAVVAFPCAPMSQPLPRLLVPFSSLWRKSQVRVMKLVDHIDSCAEGRRPPKPPPHSPAAQPLLHVHPFAHGGSRIQLSSGSAEWADSGALQENLRAKPVWRRWVSPDPVAPFRE